MSDSRKDLCAVILAAGEGKRMKSCKPKVMLEVLLKPMLGWVMDAARAAGVGDMCIVTGHLEEQVKAYLNGSAVTVTQHERKGTGHAVMMAREFLEAHKGGRVLIACGDAPFLDSLTITQALEQHIARGDAVTVISAALDDPSGYGRIIRTHDGAVNAIVEQKEGTPEQLEVREVNSGAYWFDVDSLLQVLDPEHLTASGITGEHYLTDAVAALISIGLGAGAYTAMTSDVVLGANNPVQLHDLGEKARTRIIDAHISAGIGIPCADGVIIGSDAVIGHDTLILPGTIIKGKSVIGSGCIIGPNTFIDSCTIGDNVTVNASQLTCSTVCSGTTVGPFAHIRSGCVLRQDVHIGNFVELKNSTVGEGTFVSHLAYVGDSDVGSNVNIGCGAVTVNFDGRDKHRCSIGDGAFVGCNCSLIAPVKVGANAFTAAGTVITEEVPDGTLAIGRSRQENKPGWSDRHLK